MQELYMLKSDLNDVDIASTIIKPIGYISSPFSEKFAIPRQSSLVHHGLFYIKFYKPYSNPQAFEGIEDFSHLWLIFLFDKIPEKEFSPMVRPPRLGGNAQKGVFATRSPFRPNRIGLSVVKLLEVIKTANEVSLRIEGADLLDKTPILDVKPYIKFVDSIDDAKSGYANEPPSLMKVEFSKIALEKIQNTKIAQFKELIIEVLSQDPRPAYRHRTDSDSKSYGVLLYGINVIWCVINNIILVTDLNFSK
jgi:tRNA-Thr(GGU) m(6)t(6)A37 methyltransferase TsaA